MHLIGDALLLHEAISIVQGLVVTLLNHNIFHINYRCAFRCVHGSLKVGSMCDIFIPFVIDTREVLTRCT